MTEASFQMLIDMCEEVGWERGIKALIYNAEFETIEELINYYENLT